MDASVSTAATAVETVSQKFSNNASEALALLINKVTSGIDQASDFLVAQVPDVIHQLLIYNLVTSLALCVAGLIGMIAFPVTARMVYRKFGPTLPSTSYGLSQGDLAGMTAICGVVGGLGSFGMFAANFAWLKIWLAPKIWLIEYSVDLIKKTSGH